MKRISLKGVLIGNIVDILSTNLAMFPVTIIVFILSGSAAAELAASNPRALLATPLFRALSFLFGALSSVLGGYVAGRLAKHDGIVNGALSSLLCMGLGVYATISGHGSLLMQLALLPVSPVLAGVGGYLSSRRSEPKTRDA